ncbi:low temperature requirement protein A [Demequina sp.]|uniref:low temperature requirement protein A n=1 Tax=Demequina sp. TaxID=2050685 RepID=UPI003D151258
MSEAPVPPSHEPERHASWPELFFDLVAVAGVGIVAQQLEQDQSWQHVGVLAVTFAAFWILWASVTTYGNLRADNTSLVVLFAGMAVLGTMAAAVPGIYDDHARVFAIAFVVGRLIVARPWSRASVVVDMPIVQASIGVIPWIVSIWIEGDARYVWWAVGIVLDLWVLATESGEKRVAQAQERLNNSLAMRKRRLERAPQNQGSSRRAVRRAEALESGRYRGREIPTTITALTGDEAHRAERMGLFVLIVLGEGIVQLTVAAAAAEHWDRALLISTLGAFALVCELFVVSVLRGTAGIALLPGSAIPPRAMWLGHLVVAMSLVTLMAALGKLLEEPGEPASVHTAWMLAIGIGAYGLLSGLAHLFNGTARRWGPALAIGAPLLVAGAVVLGAHESVRAGAVGWILAAAVGVAAGLGVRLLDGGGLRRGT